MELFNVNSNSVQFLLSQIEAKLIAIPEIQRPFVWSSSKVRDFVDSLYQGYPVGYIITWKTPTVRLKDGNTSADKLILIDGQQRVAALMTALQGRPIIGKDYSSKRIVIAFHPMDEKFEVSNPAIRKNSEWISDISALFASDFSPYDFVQCYCEENGLTDIGSMFKPVDRLTKIAACLIGNIQLSSELDIQTVSEIFIRINSKGVVLNAADFAMSRMAANENYNGHELRKCIDYFCHLAVAPQSFSQLSEDSRFAGTRYFEKMTWLKNEKDDLYDPSYRDMLRVTFTSEFGRGKLENLVALLSGRNFETRTFEESIAEESFKRLEQAVFRFMNESNFKTFVTILRAAGFINVSMIRSRATVNFAYVLFLTMRKYKCPAWQIEEVVMRWFVMSILTQRYSSSPESAFGRDIRNLDPTNPQEYLQVIERAELSDAFWEAGLPQRLKSAVASSPFFNVYLASQVKMKDRGFLSKSVFAGDLIAGMSHKHHVFPRNFLKKHHVMRNRYNQIANYVIMQPSINISVGDKAPSVYLSEVIKQCETGQPVYGLISERDELRENLRSHCIPEGTEEMGIEDYDEFLVARRKLMSYKIRDYYRSLRSFSK